MACIEHNATAVATLKRNRPDWPVSEPEDIEDALVRLTPNAVCLRRLQLDLLAGGPPCQPFSKAAQWAQSSRRGLDDPRGACVEAFVELADRFLPAVILIENVQGFAQGSQSALTFLERRLAEVNLKHKTKYALHWRVMNAADYGVPQRRRRAILVARRDGGSWSWPDPTHDHKPCRSWDAIGGLKPTNGGPPPGEWGELLQSIPEGWNYQWLTEKGKGRRLFGYRTKFWSFLLKLSKNQPSWTLSANPAQNAGPFHWGQPASDRKGDGAVAELSSELEVRRRLRTAGKADRERDATTVRRGYRPGDWRAGIRCRVPEPAETAYPAQAACREESAHETRGQEISALRGQACRSSRNRTRTSTCEAVL